MARRRTETEGPIWPPGPDVGLTDFHFALLILCASADDGLSAYDIELRIESGRGGVLGRSAAHVYKEIKVLEQRGYLEVEPRGRSRRRVYRITVQGRKAAPVGRARPAEPAADRRFGGVHLDQRGAVRAGRDGVEGSPAAVGRGRRSASRAQRGRASNASRRNIDPAGTSRAFAHPRPPRCLRGVAVRGRT